MAFLMAEILGLLVLAAVLGGAFVYWWIHRDMVDVTSEFAIYEHSHGELDRLRAEAQETAGRIAALEAERDGARSMYEAERSWRSILEEKLEALRPPSLDPVMAKLDGLRPPSLDPLMARLGAIDDSVRAVPFTDMSGVEIRLSEVEAKLGALGSSIRNVPVTPATDLSGVETRLASMEELLRDRPASTPQRTPGQNLLERPTNGKPDDLKRIRGVGPKLERLLHETGVFYFWQVAEWDQDDVEYVDNKLDVFKGRIQRDEWVWQARLLSGQMSRLPATAGV